MSMTALHFIRKEFKDANRAYPSRVEDVIIYGSSRSDIEIAALRLAPLGDERGNDERPELREVDTSLLANAGQGVDWKGLENLVSEALKSYGWMCGLFISPRESGIFGTFPTSLILPDEFNVPGATMSLDDRCHTVYLVSGYDRSRLTSIPPVCLVAGESFNDTIGKCFKSRRFFGFAEIYVSRCDGFLDSAKI
jgi:hypothetical protein